MIGNEGGRQEMLFLCTKFVQDKLWWSGRRGGRPRYWSEKRGLLYLFFTVGGCLTLALGLLERTTTDPVDK